MEEIIFKAVITTLLSLCLFLLKRGMDSIEKIQRSISDLNLRIASLIEKDLSKNEKLVSHKERLDKLELEIASVRELILIGGKNGQNK